MYIDFILFEILHFMRKLGKKGKSAHFFALKIAISFPVMKEVGGM